MKEELDKQLIKDFPKHFGQRHMDMSVTCMCWGFPGDGWEPLIRKVAAAAEKYNDTLDNPEEYIQATQVKEKYGTLRYYVSHANDEIYKLIDEAEEASEITCENCGAPCKTQGTGWVVTLCDKCKN